MDAEYRNPVLAKEIMDSIKDMDEEDLKAVLGVVRRLKGKETLTYALIHSSIMGAAAGRDGILRECNSSGSG